MADARRERVKREVPTGVGAIQSRGYIGGVIDALLGRTSALNLDKAVTIQKGMANVINGAIENSGLAQDEATKNGLNTIAKQIVAGSVKVTAKAFGHELTYVAEATAKAKELAEAASKANAEQIQLEKDIEAQIVALRKEKEESAKETASYVSAVEAVRSDVDNAVSFFG